MSVEFQNAYGWMTLPAMILAVVTWCPLWLKAIMPRLSDHTVIHRPGLVQFWCLGGLIGSMLTLNIALAALIAGLA